jgi:hypothetical protein
VLSDCLSLVQRINLSSQDRSLVRVVVKDIKEITSPISLVTFRHISRLCNNSAHLLARRSLVAFPFVGLFLSLSMKNCVLIMSDQ